MLDAVIEVTGADKGFVLLLDEADEPRRQPTEGEQASRPRLAQRQPRERSPTTQGGVSDSIVRQRARDGPPGHRLRRARRRRVRHERERHRAAALERHVRAAARAGRGARRALRRQRPASKHLFEQPQLELLTIFAAQASLILQNAMLVNELRADKAKLAARAASSKRFGEIIGVVRRRCRRSSARSRRSRPPTSPCSSPARPAPARSSSRASSTAARRAPSGPFVTINCGAIPENLLESELFGHVRARSPAPSPTSPGKFQAADGGTLFLDEIGELPLDLQVKLLRALQERVVVRVGDTKPETVDIRVVAATNRDLEDEIKRGRFREDLYYRLNVVNLQLPPLRERGDDVLVIAQGTCSQRTPTSTTRKVQGLHAATRSSRSASTPGRATSASSRTASRRRSCSATRRCSAPRTSTSAADALHADPAARRRPRKSSSATTSTRCSSATTATAPNRARPRRRSAHHLPPPREGAAPHAERRPGRLARTVRALSDVSLRQ